MKIFYNITQRIVWITFNILFRLFISISVYDPSHVRKRLPHPIIIASNHKTAFDMFLFGITLPFFSPIIPMRFMATYDPFKTPALELLRKTRILFIIYTFLAAFPSGRGLGADRATDLPAKLVKEGYSILMFPEGTRVFDNVIGTFKRGIAVLALKSGVPVLPVALVWKKGIIRSRLSIRFGSPMHIDATRTPEDSAKMIENEVRRLYFL